MKQRPKCECGREAFILLGGVWICGECMKLWNDSMNKEISDRLRKLREDKNKVSGPVISNGFEVVKDGN